MAEVINMNYAPKRERLEKDVILRITRVLPGKGKINVAKNQEVTPDEILGSGQVSSGFRTLNISALLSVHPRDIKKYFQKSLGQKIYKGELLAFKSGWFGQKKAVIAPTDGILDYVNEKTGEIRLTFLPQRVDLPAGVYGIVEGVDHHLGNVAIRTEVSRIFGVFGSGRVRDGVLHLLGKRDDLLTRSMISQTYADQILVGGSLIFKDAISATISADIKGIITGGINAADYKSMAGGRIIFPKKLENDVGISIVVCEGFGSCPIGQDIYETLAKYNGKFVVIDGNKGLILLPSYSSSSMLRIRKISLPKEELLQGIKEEEILELKVGMKVRVVGPSYMGEQGKIINMDAQATLLPSGIRSFLATIETERRKIKVPPQNLEIIG